MRSRGRLAFQQVRGLHRAVFPEKALPCSTLQPSALRYLPAPDAAGCLGPGAASWGCGVAVEFPRYRGFLTPPVRATSQSDLTLPAAYMPLEVQEETGRCEVMGNPRR